MTQDFQGWCPVCTPEEFCCLVSEQGLAYEPNTCLETLEERAMSACLECKL